MEKSSHASKIWDEITYPFPNCNGCTVEILELISNFIPHLIMDMITYPCWDQNYSMLVKGAIDVLAYSSARPLVRTVRTALLHMFSIPFCGFLWFQVIFYIRWRHTQWPTESREISRHFVYYNYLFLSVLYQTKIWTYHLLTLILKRNNWRSICKQLPPTVNAKGNY